MPDAIRAENLHLASKRGLVYGPLDWSLDRGSLGVVTGPPDSGKSTLMLTFTGRMRPSPGSVLEVLGHSLPLEARAVQHQTSVMGVAGLDDLDDVVTVRSTVHERLAWLAPWYKVVGRPSDDTIAEVCTPAFGDFPIPTGRTRVYQLSEASNLLLRIALALASKPDLIAVDSIDQLHAVDERDVVWERLRAIAASGVTVVASCTSFREVRRHDWAAQAAHLDLSTTASVTDAPTHDTIEKDA